MMVAMQGAFEPRLQHLSQCAADLATHNAVQDTLVGQISAQLANTSARLQATRPMNCRTSAGLLQQLC